MLSFPRTGLRWLKSACLALGVGLLSSCQSVTEIAQPAIFTTQKLELQAGYTPAEKASIEKNCYGGVPVVAKPVGRLLLVARDGYVLYHSSAIREPLWVAEGMKANQFVGPASRIDNFAPDPKVTPESDRSTLTDYNASGYDRGHQAPAADFKRSQKMTDESFYLSNMAPQIGAGFNRAIWANLEDFVREMITKNGSGYVITGPMFYDPAEEDPATADGIVKVKWIGHGRVAVPTHFYKIVILPHPNGKTTCVAFVLENKKYLTGKTYDFSKYIKAVDWIEKRVGINFMPDLDPKEERDLESQPGHL